MLVICICVAHDYLLSKPLEPWRKKTHFLICAPNEDSNPPLLMHCPQRAHDVYTTSAQRRCNVMTLHRRWGDVVLTPCACWVGSETFLCAWSGFVSLSLLTLHPVKIMIKLYECAGLSGFLWWGKYPKERYLSFGLITLLHFKDEYYVYVFDIVHLLRWEILRKGKIKVKGVLQP